MKTTMLEYLGISCALAPFTKEENEWKPGSYKNSRRIQSTISYPKHFVA